MKRRKLPLILAAILLIVLAGILFFGFSYLGWGFGPQLTDIEVGMTLEEVEEMIPGVSHLPYYDTEPIVFRHQNQLACVFFDREDKIVGYAVYSSQRRLLKSNMGKSRPYDRIYPAAMAHEDFSTVTMYDLMDKYGFEYFSSANFYGYYHPFLLDNGYILILDGRHTITENFIFPQEPVDKKGRKLQNNAVIGTVSISDLFRYEPGMRWAEFGKPTEIYHIDTSLWWVMADRYIQDYCTRHSIEYTYIEFWKEIDDPEMRDHYTKAVAEFAQMYP